AWGRRRRRLWVMGPASGGRLRAGGDEHVSRVPNASLVTPWLSSRGEPPRLRESGQANGRDQAASEDVAPEHGGRDAELLVQNERREDQPEAGEQAAHLQARESSATGDPQQSPPDHRQAHHYVA